MLVESCYLLRTGEKRPRVSRLRERAIPVCGWSPGASHSDEADYNHCLDTHSDSAAPDTQDDNSYQDGTADESYEDGTADPDEINFPVAGGPQRLDTQIYPLEGSQQSGEPYVESIPLFRNNFEPESPADEFCFMCEYGEQGARELSNPYYNQLHKIINRGAGLPIGQLCRIIERFYNTKLKDHEEHGRAWTLRSIETHLIHHGGLSEEGRASILRNIHFSSVWHLVQHELLVKGETGTLCNLPALTAIRSATQQFMALSKKN